MPEFSMWEILGECHTCGVSMWDRRRATAADEPANRLSDYQI